MNETFASGFFRASERVYVQENLLIFYLMWIPPAFLPLLFLLLHISMFKIWFLTTANLCKMLLLLIYRNENQQPHSCSCLSELHL